MNLPPHIRLDEHLVEAGFFESRSRARDAVSRGTVLVDGAPATKPAQKVLRTSRITVDDPAARYVSRAALKLVEGLRAADFNPQGRIALDIGASTGGFTQVLLEAGAAHVVALDVGHEQLHASLRDDARVTVLEGVNARYLEADTLDGHLPDLIVSDVSFISLTLALPPALALAAPGCAGVFLVKPQFEAGRKAIGKNGIVAADVAAQAADRLYAWLDAQDGWSADGMVPSPIQGGDGNTEYLLWGHKAR